MNRSCIASACVVALSAFPGIAFAQASVQACALLTAPEVTQLLGVTVLPGHEMGGGSISVCIFAPTPKFGMGERQISLTVSTPGMYDAMRAGRGTAVVTSATVPGAEAYFFTVGKTTTIHVRKNGKAFDVRMNPGRDGHETQAQIEAIETSLATKAAARV
jgi:hypothetical protein